MNITKMTIVSINPPYISSFLQFTTPKNPDPFSFILSLSTLYHPLLKWYVSPGT